MARLQCERSVVNSPAQQFLGQNLWMFSSYVVNSTSTDRNFCFWSHMSACFLVSQKLLNWFFCWKVSAKQVPNKHSLVLEESSWIGHTHLVNGVHRVFIIKALYNVPPIHTHTQAYSKMPEGCFWTQRVVLQCFVPALDLTGVPLGGVMTDDWQVLLGTPATQATPSYNPELPAALDWMNAFIRGLTACGFHAVWKHPLTLQKYYMNNR